MLGVIHNSSYTLVSIPLDKAVVTFDAEVTGESDSYR